MYFFCWLQIFGSTLWFKLKMHRPVNRPCTFFVLRLSPKDLERHDLTCEGYTRSHFNWPMADTSLDHETVKRSSCKCRSRWFLMVIPKNAVVVCDLCGVDQVLLSRGQWTCVFSACIRYEEIPKTKFQKTKKMDAIVCRRLDAGSSREEHDDEYPKLSKILLRFQGSKNTFLSSSAMSKIWDCFRRKKNSANELEENTQKEFATTEIPMQASISCVTFLLVKRARMKVFRQRKLHWSLLLEIDVNTSIFF